MGSTQRKITFNINYNIKETWARAAHTYNARIPIVNELAAPQVRW